MVSSGVRRVASTCARGGAKSIGSNGVTATTPIRALSTTSGSIDTEKVVEASTRRVMSLFEKYGDSDYIGEPMSITEHSIQTAAACKKNGESEEAQLSCLLHDVGHLLGLEAGNPPGMDGCGTENHEKIGAEFLGKLGFSDTVSYLALHHVDAKRYLCTREEGYFDKLTEASKTTLGFQGGPMTEAECQEVEKDPRWPLVLRMRTYDEAGKDPTVQEKPPSEFLRDIEENLRTSLSQQLAESQSPKKEFPVSEYASTYVLSEEQLDMWDRDGYLVVENALPAATVARLDKLAHEIAALPKSGKENDYAYPWLVHHEISSLDNSLNICRVENFCKHHSVWGDICFNLVQDLVSQAYREPSVLFKDKMNFKGPGGGAFLCHQDATAYATEDLASRHISVMVAIDAATPENGPLQVTPGRHREGIFPNEAGVIDKSIEDSMEFIPVMVKPGDIVLFDSFLPHRSDPNLSNTWRRLAYLTFNVASEGDLHSKYYSKKIDLMRKGEAGSISINKDFGGNVV